MSNLSLNEFADATYEEWKQAAEEALKGAAFDKKLITRTHEGIALQPIYNQSDLDALQLPEAWPGLPPFGRGNQPAPKAPLVAQEIPCGTPELFNKAALTDFMLGQNALAIQLDVASRRGLDPSEADTTEVAHCGLSLACLADANVAFEGIEASAIEIFLWTGASALPMLGLLSAHSDQWRGGILADPLTEYARDGVLPIALDDAFTEMAAAAKWSSENGNRLRTIGVGAALWSDAGGTAVDELSIGLATAVEYLRELDSRGITPTEAAPQFVFTHGLGSNVFMEIAKLRASRLLWSRVLAATGAAPVAAHIHARSSIFNKSVLDPHTNMLRTTSEAFVGTIAGADSMHVAAFDEAIRTPNDFSRRIARNVHTILAEECEFENIADAAGGSWYVESLTLELAGKAWAAFQEIEKQGGMSTALLKGIIQSTMEKSAAARLSAAATRRDGYIGVNLFPNTAETPLNGEPFDSRTLHAERARFIEELRPHTLPKIERSVAAVAAAFADGATLSQIGEALPRSAPCEPEIKKVRVCRAAEGFESLRANALRHYKSTGKPATAWLANFGPAKQHKARADFSAGFLAAGGFEIAQGPGATSIDEAVKAAIESHAKLVVLCSTDDTYPDLVPAFVSAFKAKKPKAHVLLAGYPTGHIEAFQAAGIDDFLHIRLNCLEFLTHLQKTLGIAH